MSSCNPNVAKLKPEEDLPKVQTFLEELIQRGKVPGISVAMNVNGVTLEAVAGISDAQTGHPMTPDMHFELGCLNKFLTALIVLELVSEGKIDLDQVISYYLPELTGKNGNIIRARHLLSHSAGYQGENITDPDIQQDYSYEEFVATFNQRPLLFEPGTVFDYSHSASVILGRIIEAVTGRQSEELVQERILRPLGIKTLGEENTDSSKYVRGHQLHPETGQLNTPFTIDWCDFWQGSLGALWITMPDLVKLGEALIDGRVLSEESRALLLSHEVKLPGMFTGKNAEQPFVVSGLGCARYVNGTYGARSNSIGQSIGLRFAPDKGIAIAVGMNAESPHLRDFCINKLFNSLLPEDATDKTELAPPENLEITLDSIHGKYEGSEGSVFTITGEDRKLIFKVNSSSSSEEEINAFTLSVTEDDNGNIDLSDIPDALTIGFSKPKNTSPPIVIVGGQAYRQLP